EGVLAADLVTEPAEEERPQRPDKEAHREDGHRAEEGRDRVAFLEELDGEDRGQAAEDVEVVPLDDVADGCRNDDAAELVEWNLGCPHWPPLFSSVAGITAPRRCSRRRNGAFPTTAAATHRGRSMPDTCCPSGSWSGAVVLFLVLVLLLEGGHHGWIGQRG